MPVLERWHQNKSTLQSELTTACYSSTMKCAFKLKKKKECFLK